MSAYVPVCVWVSVSVPVCTFGGVPDVGVEGLPKRVEEAHQCCHGGEEENSGHGTNPLQHRVDPHTRHLVHPVRPAGGGAKRQRVRQKDRSHTKL